MYFDVIYRKVKVQHIHLHCYEGPITLYDIDINERDPSAVGDDILKAYTQ